MFIADNLKQLKHCFFSRRGGTSTGYFDSLNFAFTKGDTPDNIRANQKIALQKMDALNAHLILCEQVHSAKVVVATKETASQKADALVSTTPNVVIGVLTADCVPVLLADVKRGVIGAAHAGWKGALGGVIGNTVESMQSLGADPNNIHAAIGPCIAQSSYEVGAEILESFTNAQSGSDRFFKPSQMQGHHMFDLSGFVHNCLQQSGVQNIENLKLDTYSNADLFFSCRRANHKDEPTFGCGLSAIMLPAC